MFPVAWCIFTLIRGEIVGWYPYPFIDVDVLGYGKVLVNCVWIAVLYLGVAAALTTFDGWLARVGGRAEAIPFPGSARERAFRPMVGVDCSLDTLAAHL